MLLAANPPATASDHSLHFDVHRRLVTEPAELHAAHTGQFLRVPVFVQSFDGVLLRRRWRLCALFFAISSNRPLRSFPRVGYGYDQVRLLNARRKFQYPVLIVQIENAVARSKIILVDTSVSSRERSRNSLPFIHSYPIVRAWELSYAREISASSSRRSYDLNELIFYDVRIYLIRELSSVSCCRTKLFRLYGFFIQYALRASCTRETYVQVYERFA